MKLDVMKNAEEEDVDDEDEEAGDAGVDEDEAEEDTEVTEEEGGDVCMQPQEAGPCSSHETRWYFYHDESRCVQFQYGGCHGNQNNFETENECMTACGTHHKPTSTGNVCINAAAIGWFMPKWSHLMVDTLIQSLDGSSQNRVIEWLIL